MWQVEQRLSLACGPPAWFLPVAKLTSSWQDPQAAALGFAANAFAWAAPVVCSWQNWQRRGSLGSSTVDQSETALLKPTIWYGVPACTLGSSLPMCSLCANTFMSSVFPVSGLVVCGWWHITQRSNPWRDPP